MPRLFADISISLDGYAAGPDATAEDPLGVGGEQLHDWVLPLKAWREPHGLEGGEESAESEAFERLQAAAGAEIMGRRMFSGGSGPWEDDPKANGWWGDEPPFRHHVFVLTHHERERLEMQGGTTFHFITGGIESALEQARAAASEKNVAIGGGADVIQQYLRAGLVDEFMIHVAPVFLGDGVRLFDPASADQLPRVELLGTIDSPNVSHLRYRVVNRPA